MLKIKRITIKNYRQYKDIQLSFIDSKGIFLFVGKNGIGKSNFLNAICWCLYEEQPFRFHDTEKKLLNEEAAKINQFEEVKVSIEVEMDDHHFLFTRTQRESQRSYLNVMIKQGDDWEEMPNPTITINNFLPKSIRQFFLFDGEAVQNIFKGDYSSNLKKSIWKVSHVELIDSAIDHLTKVIDGLRKSVSKGAPELTDLEARLTEIDSTLATSKSDKDAETAQLNDLKENIKKLRKEAEHFSKYRDLLDRRNQLEELHAQAKIRDENCQKEINNLIIILGPFLYIKDSLAEMAIKISEGKEKGEIPPKIKSTFIKELLDKGECICGNEIKTSEHATLVALLNRVEPSDRRSYLLEDSYEINSVLHDIQALPSHMRSLREQRAVERRQIEGFERELKEVRELLKNAPDKEVGNIESTIQRIENQIDLSSQKIGQVDAEIIRLTQEKKDLEDELTRLAKTRDSRRFDLQKLEFASDALERIKQIQAHLIDQVRRAVSHNADKYFKDLVWKKGEFERIEFTDEYDVLVLKRGQDVSSLEDLSTGETKVLGFATIKALAELSGFREVPVFIDGPLENLDPEVASNFLDSLPNFMPNKQIFVFSLDKESIKKFGSEQINPENFYQLTREKDSISTIIRRYNATN